MADVFAPSGPVVVSGTPAINNQQVGGQDVQTVAAGTQLIALSGPLGDPLDTVNNALSVNALSKLTDGTNIANILTATGTVAGQNAQLIAPAVLTIPFSTSQAGAQVVLQATDVSHYSYIEVVYTSVGSGLALQGQWSPSPSGPYLAQTAWSVTAGIPNANLGATAGLVYTSPIRGNFFQINVTALTSGTFAGTITLRTFAPQSTGIVANSSQAGTWTVGINNGLMPSGTALNTYSVQISTSTTTTPTASTCYISSIVIVTVTGVAATTLTIQDKSGTPLILVDGLATTNTLAGAPVPINFQTPIKMVSGIDIVTAGVSPATNNVWIDYYQ